MTAHLPALIADYLRNHPGENQSTIARRGGMGKGTVWALMNPSDEYARSMPRPETLARLALGLEMPLERVREAAALDAGYGLPGAAHERPEIRRLLATIEGFDAEKLEAVQRRADLMRQEMLEEQKRKPRRRPTGR